MGCDIHIVVERRKKGKDRWVGIYCTDFLSRTAIPVGRRDYDFFGEVANVRSAGTSGNYPRNLPEDISDLAWQQYMTAPTDHHSASHMSVEDMAACWIKANTKKDEMLRDTKIREDFAVWDLFGYGIDPEEGKWEYRAVFWFDN